MQLQTHIHRLYTQNAEGCWHISPADDCWWEEKCVRSWWGLGWGCSDNHVQVISEPAVNETWTPLTRENRPHYPVVFSGWTRIELIFFNHRRQAFNKRSHKRFNIGCYPGCAGRFFCQNTTRNISLALICVVKGYNGNWCYHNGKSTPPALPSVLTHHSHILSLLLVSWHPTPDPHQAHPRTVTHWRAQHVERQWRWPQ